MNAQDNDPITQTHDANLLATVDRVLTNPEGQFHPAQRAPGTRPQAELTPKYTNTFEQLCTDLVTAVPHADPAFQARLHEHLTGVIEQRGEQARGPRLHRLIPHLPSGRSGSRTRRRLVSMAAAVLVAAGGIGTYLHEQTPTPVSAQAVLHRAAAVTPGANQVMHATYTLSAAGGLTGTADVWVGLTGVDKAPEIALTQTVLRNGHAAPDLSTRLVEKDGTLQVYDPATNTVTQLASDRQIRVAGPPAATPAQDLEGILIGTRVAQKLSRALQAGMQPTAFQLQQQTLDGTPVYVLVLDPKCGGGCPPSQSQTYYFSTQSYALQGADWVENGVTWHARLAQNGYGITALSTVPANTFTLNAPAGAHRVVLSTPANTAKGNGMDEVIVAAAAACGTTPQALAAATQMGGKSILDACQATAQGMTIDRLVTAVMVPFKSGLDAQVASNQITAAAENAELANISRKLTVVLGGKSGTTQGGKSGGAFKANSGTASGSKQP